MEQDERTRRTGGNTNLQTRDGEVLERETKARGDAESGRNGEQSIGVQPSERSGRRDNNGGTRSEREGKGSNNKRGERGDASFRVYDRDYDRSSPHGGVERPEVALDEENAGRDSDGRGVREMGTIPSIRTQNAVEEKGEEKSRRRETRVRGTEDRSKRREKERKTRQRETVLTTPREDKLPSTFQKPPVILERRPQPAIPLQSKEDSISTSESAASKSRNSALRGTGQVPSAEGRSSSERLKAGGSPYVVKMMTEQNRLQQDQVLRVLGDQPGHFVIGVIGTQGSGKSTLMSRLSGVSTHVFPSQTTDTHLSACHETTGIDLHVTSERIILLDAQPVLSLSVLERALRNDLVPEGTHPEHWQEIQNLQHVIFLLAVCNVVLVVSDWAPNFELWNLVREAAVLKYQIPSMPTVVFPPSPKDQTEYLAEVVFVVNKASQEEMSLDRYEELCTVLQSIFKRSELSVTGGASISRCLPIYSSTGRDAANLFFLPAEELGHRVKEGTTNLRTSSNQTRESTAPSKKFPNTNGASYTECLRDMVFSAPRLEGKKGQASEREWFRSAVRTWDLIGKSEFLREFVRTRRKTSIFMTEV